MATDTLLRRSGPRGPVSLRAALILPALLLLAGNVGAQCGAAVIGEKAQPAAIQGLGTAATVRIWASSQASSASILDPCAGSACAALDASSLCEGGGDCLAVTGINWLNGSCATTGFLPQATVILAEGTTAEDGGRWAAARVNHNAGDANADLDAAQERICSGCSSEASPLIGGGQLIGVTLVDQSGDLLTLGLSWAAPRAQAEALGESGPGLVTAYTLWVARVAEGGAPAMTGDTAGWTPTPDTDATHIGDNSTDTQAEIVIDLAGNIDAVWVAIGLIFDGSGDPASDPNSLASTVISRGVLAYVPSIGLVGIFADGFETGDTTLWSDVGP